MKPPRFFASDNNAPVHPLIMTALSDANEDHQIAYGDDPFTDEALSRLREVFGKDAKPFLVYNGTGANVTSLAAVLKPHQGVICPETAHINMDECGALERFAGSKTLPVAGENGKIRVSMLKHHLKEIGNEHASQPRVISVSQTTELGTVYTAEEIREIADFAHSNNMLLHMDGARISNAAAALGVNFPEITSQAGVDVLSFGCTKNGLMFGEAVIFFGTEEAEWYKYVRKQGMQLASKMRYIAVQYEAILKDSLWYKNALHANKMAALLAAGISELQGVVIRYPVEANAVFASLPVHAIKPPQDKYPFYVWDHTENIVRLMCSFDTTAEDVHLFIDCLRSALQPEKSGGAE